MNKGSSCVGTCALCRNTAPLCDSHLIPKAVFRLLRKMSARNRSPIVFGEGFAYATDRQVADYLLCRDCEDRFGRRGESWTLENCFRGTSRFRLRSYIESVTPDDQYDDLRIYSLAKNPMVTADDTDRLIYSAMSVFWRAAAHEWSIDGRLIHVNLGSYCESFRLFLLDQGPFPPNTVLVVRLVSDDRMSSFMNAPESKNGNGFHYHSFTIPGMMFLLYAGGKLPSAYFDRSTAPNPGRYVSVCPSGDMTWVADMAARHRSAGC